MTGPRLLRRVLTTEEDVFAVRHQGRQLGALLGLGAQDQVRIAAALSEVGRRLLGELGPVMVSAALVTPPDEPRLELVASSNGEVGEAFLGALAATHQLIPQWTVSWDDGRTTVVMAWPVPARVAALPEQEIRRIRAEVTQMTAGTPLEELAEHNRQLVATLEVVQAHRDELLRVNAELAETNQGVLALYTELSGELEATNRGVVALYAELDQRNAQTRAANEAKTRFLANVSHELRAPVTAMIGLLRLLRDPASDPLSAEQTNALALVDGSAQSLLQLVNELLDLAKAESGRIEPQLEEVALADIFATLAGTLRAVPRSPATLLEVSPPRTPPLRTDPILLTQVLRNLITNALKFTPHGEVRLHASYEPGDTEVGLHVADTGIGIPPEEHERVFEEFHQVRHALQAGVRGTGLGLPYARRLVALLGGRLDLVSAPGEGSTFTVHLPLAAVMKAAS